MEVRQAINSEYAKTLDTTGLRKVFLVDQVFERDALKLWKCISASTSPTTPPSFT
ncbi:hypothetical protein PQR01_19140 [Paraburkholderia rhynchosiae]|uniref:Uncharacterized protein n=2 Tax=Paraburkholderia TaxID=1822464 RepID=A0ACC7NDF1_9BURK